MTTAIEQTLPAVTDEVPADWVEENVAELQEMNGESWSTMQESGVREGAALHVEFAFSARNEESAGDLAEYLEVSADYEAAAASPETETDAWTVKGTTSVVTATPAGLDEWVRRMIAVGWAHGECWFDGWSAILA